MQGSVVKQLKKDGANANVLEPEIAKLLALRQHLDEAKKATGAASDEKPFNRDCTLNTSNEAERAHSVPIPTRNQGASE